MQKKLQHFGIKNPLYSEAYKNLNEVQKMSSIKEEAKNYISPTTDNIADLKSVNVDVEIFEKEAVDNDGKPFKYKYILINNKEFRVPLTVLKQLKVLLKEKPDMKEFSVKKEGEGLATSYVVIPK